MNNTNDFELSTIIGGGTVVPTNTGVEPIGGNSNFNSILERARMMPSNNAPKPIEQTAAPSDLSQPELSGDELIELLVPGHNEYMKTAGDELTATFGSNAIQSTSSTTPLQSNITSSPELVDLDSIDLSDLGGSITVKNTPTDQPQKSVQSNPKTTTQNVPPVVQQSSGVLFETPKDDSGLSPTDYTRYKKKFDRNKFVTHQLTDYERYNEVQERNKSQILITSKFVAPISGYSGNVSAMTLKDKIKFLSALEDPITRIEGIYHAVYNKIESLSMGKMTYQEWISNTSFIDFDAILFALYEASFIGAQSFDISCAHCGKANTLKLNSKELIRVVGDGKYLKDTLMMLEKTSDTFNYQNELLEIYNKSLMKNPDTFELPNSKYLFDVNYVSILDNLRTEKAIREMAASAKDNADRDSIVSFSYIHNLCNSIKAIHIPKFDEYYSITSSKDIFDELEYISSNYPEDFSILVTIIGECVHDNKVAFQTPKYRCASCKEVNDNVELDLVKTIFFNIRRILAMNE